MTTTAVFAEVLVAGIEATVWLVLLAFAIAQPDKFDISRLAPLKEWAVLITTFTLALAYAIGIIVDRVADTLFKAFFRKTPSDVPMMRLQVLARGDKVTDFVEYIRSRIRVSRATMVNLAVTAIVLPVFLRRCTAATSLQIVAAFLVLVALTGVAAFAAVRIGQAYDARVKEAATMPLPKAS
jgi:hypothetical protein